MSVDLIKDAAFGLGIGVSIGSLFFLAYYLLLPPIVFLQ